MKESWICKTVNHKTYCFFLLIFPNKIVSKLKRHLTKRFLRRLAKHFSQFLNHDQERRIVNLIDSLVEGNGEVLLGQLTDKV